MLNQRENNNFDASRKTFSRRKLGSWLVMTALLGTALIFSGVFYVWLQIQQVQYGYRVARLHEEYDRLLAVQRKLHLEWVRLHEPSYLEKLGRERLGLAPPLQDQKLLIP